MKKNNRFLYALPGLFLLVFLSSCLKDQLHEDQLTMYTPENRNIIELAGPGSGVAAYNSALGITLESNPADTTFNLAVVRLANADPAPEDIRVTLELAPELVAQYNTANNTQYVVPPASIYTLSGLEVTIPKGAREGYLTMKTNSQPIAAGSYAIGFRIKSIATPGYTMSGNFNNQVVRLQAKNPWDGVYKHTYTSTLGNGSNTITLVTETATRVRLANGGASLIGVYSNYQAFEVDPQTNKVTVVMTTLLPVETDPASHYDPATKTFHVKWTSNAGVRVFEQTLVRQ